MKKRTKIILSTFSLIIVGFLILMYVGFNGNPISKLLYEKELKAYLEQKYEEEFIVKERMYNFLTERYGITVQPKEDESLLFQAWRIGKGNYYDYYQERTEERMIKKEIKLIFEKHMTKINDISPNIPTEHEGSIYHHLSEKRVNLLNLSILSDESWSEKTHEERMELLYDLFVYIENEGFYPEISLQFKEEQVFLPIDAYLSFFVEQNKEITKETVQDFFDQSKENTHSESIH